MAQNTAELSGSEIEDPVPVRIDQIAAIALDDHAIHEWLKYEQVFALFFPQTEARRRFEAFHDIQITESMRC
jgi:hypothetical protein